MRDRLQGTVLTLLQGFRADFEIVTKSELASRAEMSASYIRSLVLLILLGAQFPSLFSKLLNGGYWQVRVDLNIRPANISSLEAMDFNRHLDRHLLLRIAFPWLSLVLCLLKTSQRLLLELFGE